MFIFIANINKKSDIVCDLNNFFMFSLEEKAIKGTGFD